MTPIKVDQTGVYQIQNKEQKSNQLELGSVIQGKLIKKEHTTAIDFGNKTISIDRALVENQKDGDTMQFQVSEGEAGTLRLKIVSDFMQKQGSKTMESAKQTQIMRNTEQFKSIIGQSKVEIDSSKEVQQQSEQLSTLSKEDIEKLRQMGIDVSDGQVGHLAGLISQMKQNEKQESLEQSKQQMQEQFNTLCGKGPITDSETAYLIKQGKPLTYENIYMAKYSGNEESQSSITPEEWKELAPQLDRNIEQLGLEVSKETQEAGKFLVEHDLEVSKENIALYQQVKQYNEQGYSAVDYEKQMQEVVDQLNQITAQDVEKQVENQQPLTIKNLFDIHLMSEKKENQQEQQNKSQKQPSYETVTARRKLEEARLYLSVQAGVQLLKQGVSIDTTELSELVEQLKQQEQQVLSKQYIGSFEEEKAVVFEETLSAVKYVSTISPAVYAQIQKGSQATLNEVQQAGLSYSDIVKEAFERYESVGTAPRSDMGDSITKAFREMDSLLDELNIQNTKENQKAVKILAFNQMEISKENVEKITTLDRRLNSVIEGLQPEVVLDLIRQGKNPMNLSLDELTETINETQEKVGKTKQEKYSEFLHRAEKNKEITKEERDGFIGIYRLLYQIQKKDGMDLGTVVKNQSEVTLDNLLTAHESNQSAGYDQTASDDNGFLQQQEANESKIREQIATAFAGEDVTTYNQAIVESILRQMDMKKLPAQFDVRKESLESLEQMLKDQEIEVADEEELQVKLEELKSASTISKTQITWLTEHALPLTPKYMSMAKETDCAKKLFEKMKEKKDSYINESEDWLDEIADTILDDCTEETVQKVQNEFLQKEQEQTENRVLNEQEISAMKQVHTAMNMMKQLAQKQEYLVPIACEQGVYTMHVTFAKEEGTPTNMQAKIQLSEQQEIGATAILDDGQMKFSVYNTKAPTGDLSVEEVEKQWSNQCEGETNCYEIAKAFVKVVKELA